MKKIIQNCDSNDTNDASKLATIHRTLFTLATSELFHNIVFVLKIFPCVYYYNNNNGLHNIYTAEPFAYNILSNKVKAIVCSSVSSGVFR